MGGYNKQMRENIKNPIRLMKIKCQKCKKEQAILIFQKKYFCSFCRDKDKHHLKGGSERNE